MIIIRPIRESDYQVLSDIARESGPGFTSLPENPDLLRRKIERTCDALAAEPCLDGSQGYLFVAEDTDSGEVVGTCGIETAVGLNEPWYHYRIGTAVHASRELNVYNAFRTLDLCNDYTGCAEVCTLYLKPDYRQGSNGRLLSKSRFMFMAEFPERFAERVIAEMRGYSDDQGRSPFWDGLGRHFFSMEYSEADYLTGSGNKVFIAELMPKHSIYLHLLPEAAQEVIGQVHRNTEPARRMLESEGFRFEGYIDIFDAGPTVATRLHDIRSVRDSRYVKARIGAEPPDGDGLFLVSNTKLADFRCTVAPLRPESSSVQIDQRLADALQVNGGEPLRIVPLKARQSS
ncbi:arginine N-succinyltransferase [Marinobacterium nitratireducens]|uniref:Arginine N-succinyltransferase n=1 Tax=Marinobacterium nitratireducens TaxID=518897 RepID=A0A917Z818_9GAMM|nr:arginine N-succinyltransferase [Marinobacterium nitratireducens]GGO77832.1 arginine N-succinyltransferase [Marinobacterium nitratireducens]